MRQLAASAREAWSASAGRLLIAALAFSAIAGLETQCASADTLILQGSTTLNRRFIEAHQPAIEAATGHVLTVIPNRSILGLTAVIEGRADLAMTSAPLGSEIQSLKKAVPGRDYEQLRSFPILTTRVAVAVHPSNPLRRTTLGKLREILLGQISNWSALGGPDLPIRIVLVGGGGGVMTVIESVLLNGGQINLPNVIYMKSAIQLAQVVEQDPSALGFGQLALIRQRDIPELVTDEKIEQVLSFVTFGNPSPAAQSVIDTARSIAEKDM
jgi:phosphate transport system substrate-binding protein